MSWLRCTWLGHSNTHLAWFEHIGLGHQLVHLCPAWLILSHLGMVWRFMQHLQIENLSVMFCDFTSLQQVNTMLSFLLSLDLNIFNDEKNTKDSIKEFGNMGNMSPAHMMPNGSLRNQYLSNGVLYMVQYDLNSSKTTAQYLLLQSNMLRYLPVLKVNRISLFDVQ